MGVDPAYLPGYVKFEERNEVQRISKQWNSDLEDIFKPVHLAKRLQKGEIRQS